MTFIFKLLPFVFCLNSIGAYAAPSDTDRYVAFLADLFERKSICDDELVQLIENAEQGKVINPISQDRADISIADFIDHETAQKWVDESELNAWQVANWAKENLALQEGVRTMRKQTKEETKRPWKDPLQNLSAGGDHTCAIKTDGALQCWGENSSNQCDVPADLGSVQSVSAGLRHTCAVTLDGSVRCWGDSDNGKCEVPADLGFVRSISANNHHTCAVTADQKLRCWGYNENGQCDVPDDIRDVQSVALGPYQTCVVKADGIVRCWGHSIYFGSEVDPPAHLGKVQSLSATCAVKIDGLLRCWKCNLSGCDTPFDLGPVQLVSARSTHTCALKEDGTIRCWGNNDYGQCDVPADIGTIQSLSVGNYYTCAMKDDGTVRCWGYNGYHACDVPVELGGIEPVPQKYWLADWLWN